MMARREDIETSIWSDGQFLDLPGAARYVYIWSFTNAHCNLAGLYRCGRQIIELETGIRNGALDKALESLERDTFLFYDGKVMFVRSRVKHFRTRSASIVKAMWRDVDGMGSHPFVAKWWNENRSQQWIVENWPTPVVVGDLGGLSPTHAQPPKGLQGKGKGKGTYREGRTSQSQIVRRTPRDLSEVDPETRARLVSLQERIAEQNAAAGEVAS